nr:glycoside hydrolase domain-containing protein [Chitinophaga eiseniae]
MKKLTIIGCLVSATAFAQHSGQIDAAHLPALAPHYQPEYTFDELVDSAAWKGQGSGLHVAFGSTEQAYFRTAVPSQKVTATWEATGWKNERLNAQLLVWSPDSLRQVRFTVGDLINENGKVIHHQHTKLHLVRYVLSNYPYGAKDATCEGTPYKQGFLMPDRFEDFDRFDLPGRTTRPVWLSLDVPADAAPGQYTGKVLVHTERYTDTLYMKIRVQRQLLPPPHDWQYRLDLWQNPWTVAWANHLEPWSAEHKALLKKHLQLYADAGGKYITTYGVHSPWSDNSYMIEGGMITWIKERDDSWKYDYRIFDEYVEMAMALGIDKAITIYTPVPWGNRFRYTDAATGNYVYEQWAPGTAVYRTRWHDFLNDLKAHLEKKGWFNKTYLGINENEMEQTLAAIKVIKKHSPQWRITYAGNWHKELDTLLDDYCYLYGKEPTDAQQRQRSARGATTTFYVCCNPPVPNNFVFSPPIEGRWISWYSFARGYDGFLRWAYDGWPEDPVRDARFGGWPAGDCFLVYPGGNSCIRFEKLREGIVDYEKIRILKAQVAASGSKAAKRAWQALEQHLGVFAKEHDFNEEKITGDVDKGRALVAALSDAVGQ